MNKMVQKKTKKLCKNLLLLLWVSLLVTIVIITALGANVHIVIKQDSIEFRTLDKSKTEQ